MEMKKHSIENNNIQSERSSDSSVESFIKWYCNLSANNFLVEIDMEFLEDTFNLIDVKGKIEFYQEALDTIKLKAVDDVLLNSEKFSDLYQDISDLYGLIHAIQILTPKGLAKMRKKFLAGAFGTCPKVMCERQSTLPVGLSNELHASRVKVFCPRCEEVQIPRLNYKLDLDGCYFGTSFPSLLLLTQPDLQPVPPSKIQIPKIFGFRIYMKKGSKLLNSVNKIEDEEIDDDEEQDTVSLDDD